MDPIVVSTQYSPHYHLTAYDPIIEWEHHSGPITEQERNETQFSLFYSMADLSVQTDRRNEMQFVVETPDGFGVRTENLNTLLTDVSEATYYS